MEFYYKKFTTIRKTQKLSIQKIATRLNKTYKTVWSWGTGEHKPKASDVQFLANLLCVDISEISDIQQEEKPEIYLLHSTNNNLSEQPQLRAMKDEVIRLNRQLMHHYRATNNVNKLLDSIQSLFYTKKSDLKFTYVNSSFASVIGYSKNEIIGKKNHELLKYNDVLILNKLELEVLNSGVSIKNRDIFIPGTNQGKYGLISIYPEYENNKIVSLNCCIRDITERVAAKKQACDLEKRRQILENAVNKVNECVWIGEKIDESYYRYKHIFISKAFEKIFGYGIDNFVNNKMSIYDFVHPDDIEETQINHRKDKYPKFYEYRIIRRNDNKERWLQENVYLDNNIIFGVIRDVTHLKEI